MERRGITCGGNFIIDHVKLVDLWPDEGMLSLILEEHRATGGCAQNVLIDLARLQAGIPLSGIGLVGDDEDGAFILRQMQAHGVEASRIQVLEEAPTSYTDVITVEKTGTRTFFHNKGANNRLDAEHFDFSREGARIFHAGYILLLDALDAPDPEHGTRMARVLKAAREAGCRTSVDVVSESGYRFQRLVLPALEHTDYLILNEIEAGRTAGYEVRDAGGRIDPGALRSTLEELRGKGSVELVCIHFPEGSCAARRDGESLYLPSHRMPDGSIKGTVGAGDAFCAGMLYGLHEEWDLERCMRLANAMAGVCL
ncbi:MAG: carbohydrate kinase family protein, partial [Spirochaetota bacterium]